jgi:hypothetical protein
MVSTNRTLLRLHVEAVWGVRLPPIVQNDIELLRESFRPSRRPASWESILRQKLAEKVMRLLLLLCGHAWSCKKGWFHCTALLLRILLPSAWLLLPDTGSSHGQPSLRNEVPWKGRGWVERNMFDGPQSNLTPLSGARVR